MIDEIIAQLESQGLSIVSFKESEYGTVLYLNGENFEREPVTISKYIKTVDDGVAAVNRILQFRKNSHFGQRPNRIDSLDIPVGVIFKIDEDNASNIDELGGTWQEVDEYGNPPGTALPPNVGDIDLSEYAKIAEVNNQLNLKANSNDVYTKAEVDVKLSDLSAESADIGELSVDNIEATGNVRIAGDLTVDGKTTTVNTEEVTTESNTITLRDGATTAIQPGEVSGIEIENYDGNGTTLQVAVDNEGTLRIGTNIGSSEGDNEPILTRSESEDLVNNHLLKWDAANKKAIDSGETIESLKNTKLISKPSDIGLDDSQTYTTKAFFDNMPLQSIAMVPDTYISDDKGSGTYVIYKPVTGGKAEFLPLQTTTAAAVDKTKVPTQNIEVYMNYANGSLSGNWTCNPGLYTTAGLILFGSGDIAQGTTYAGNAGTMCVGSPFGVHTEFDGNEIIAKGDATTLGTTYFHGTLNVSQADANLMIPLAAPSSPANGMIWIA